ncbi:MAG: two-component system response regulator [Rhodocyclales bacterium]|nr:two-component system response regulator [Rhodocyclales bacterium]
MSDGYADKPTLLIVDDAPENLLVLTELLQDEYRVLAATSGERALTLARGAHHPDLILLDIMMPGMDGFQTLEELRTHAMTRDIPVIFVTALEDSEVESRGLELGAVDYITKPIAPAVVRARVHTHVTLKRAQERLADENSYLEAEISLRMAESDLTEQVSIRALAHLAEARDPETGNHILRTQAYVRILAIQLRRHPRFSEVLTPRNIELLTRSAPLHDIGKVGIPDHILLKPGKLTPEEMSIMQTHARIGAEAIEKAENDVSTPVPFLVFAKEIANFHHEKWDGSGYPQGLKADEIPVSARLMALADVFDALISVRVYKPAMSYEKAREIIREGRGNHFDPDVVDAFEVCYGDFVEIANRYADH